MRIDPRDGGLDDWFVPGQGPSGDGYPDDWFVPDHAQSVQGDGYPGDWFVPASAALGVASPSVSDRPAQPDPFAA